MSADTNPILIAITMAVPGGATSFVFSLASWLKTRGNNVIVAAGEEGDWLEKRCQEAHITFRRIPHLKRAIDPLHDALAVRSFKRLLDEIRPRALHLNSSKAGVIGSLAGRLSHVPNIVYCIGGWAALDANSFWARQLYTWPERFSASWKDTIVCLHPGDAAFAEAHHIVPKKSLMIIPNGINAELVRQNLLSRAEARRQLRLPLDKIVIGTIAHFLNAKNLPQYIESCADVLKQRPDVHFCLIGDGIERPQIEQTIQKHHLNTSVTLCGAKDHAAHFLNAFDVFALPSKKEGMPFVLLEAAAANLPIVTTDVGAHRWMLPEATIVPPLQPNTLSKAIIKTIDALVYTHPDTYQKSLSRFSEETCFEAHESLLVR